MTGKQKQEPTVVVGGYAEFNRTVSFNNQSRRETVKLSKADAPEWDEPIKRGWVVRVTITKNGEHAHTMQLIASEARAVIAKIEKGSFLSDEARSHKRARKEFKDENADKIIQGLKELVEAARPA